MFMKLKLFFDSQKAAVLTLLYGVCFFCLFCFSIFSTPEGKGILKRLIESYLVP